jgi:hypothetical protein
MQGQDQEAGPFSFSHIDHGNGDREAWGLGLHVVVSRLRVRPRPQRWVRPAVLLHLAHRALTDLG